MENGGYDVASNSVGRLSRMPKQSDLEELGLVLETAKGGDSRIVPFFLGILFLGIAGKHWESQWLQYFAGMLFALMCFYSAWLANKLKRAYVAFWMATGMNEKKAMKKYYEDYPPDIG